MAYQSINSPPRICYAGRTHSLRLRSPQTDARTYALTDTTRDPNNSRFAWAQIISKPDDRNGAIVSQALPKLQTDRVYRLWAVAKPAAAPAIVLQHRSLFRLAFHKA